MSGFASGLGLLILVIVLLFTWLAVAVFVSPELAAAMGLAVIGMWIVFFVPVSFIKEIAWRGRQKKIMDEAMEGPPVAYQPGTALPPPPAMPGQPADSSAPGSLTLMNQPGSAGAIDIYRELPQLPQLEPRDHMATFRRALVLPFVGLFMFVGAQNETILHAILEARGMTQKVAVDWDAIKLPAEYADHQGSMNRAARLLLRREPSCGAVIGGRIAPLDQFLTPAQQAEQIANGGYVFEFDCSGATGNNPQPYLAWVTEDDLTLSSIAAITSFFSTTLNDEKARQGCVAAANAALAPQRATVSAIIQPTVVKSRSPSADFVRLFGNFRLVRADGNGGLIGLSCWVGLKAPATVRFTRPADTIP